MISIYHTHYYVQFQTVIKFNLYNSLLSMKVPLHVLLVLGLEYTYTKTKKSLHRPGIEPGPPAWQASILPLNHRCLGIGGPEGSMDRNGFKVRRTLAISSRLFRE